MAQYILHYDDRHCFNADINYRARIALAHCFVVFFLVVVLTTENRLTELDAYLKPH